MSKLAMHVQHYKAGAVGAIDRHNKRLGDSHSNELIVPERSGDNIAILRPDGDLYNVAREIADHAAGRVTKNSVLVSEWVIYPSEDLQDPATADPERLKAWGEDVVAWMKDKGLNPKSATIHRDETTNHIHVDTIPLTNDGRLSRKELYTREKLREYHTELAEHLQARGWDIQRGESTEGKQVRSKNVREFKKQQEAERREAERLRAEAEKAAARAEREAAASRQEAERAAQAASEARSEVQRLERVKDKLEPLQAEYEAKKAFIREADKSSDVAVMYPSYAKITEKGIFKKRKYVTVPAELWEAKHVSANEKQDLQRAEEVLERRFKEWRQKVSTLNATELEAEVKELKKDLLDLQLENARLHRENGADELIKRVNRVLSKLPKEQAEAFVEAWNKDLEHARAKDDLKPTR